MKAVPMFTGLIETLGWVNEIIPDPNGMQLLVSWDLSSEPGDSIAINGCCLTVVACEGALLRFAVSPETLRSTTLATLPVGASVQLQRWRKPLKILRPWINFYGLFMPCFLFLTAIGTMVAKTAIWPASNF